MEYTTDQNPGPRDICLGIQSTVRTHENGIFNDVKEPDEVYLILAAWQSPNLTTTSVNHMGIDDANLTVMEDI